MFCPHCGSQIVGGIKFCGFCGFPVTQTAVAALIVPSPDKASSHKDVPQTGYGRRIIILVLVIFFLILLFAAIGTNLGQATSGNIKIIINYLLGILFGINVLAVPGGVIAGVIYITKMNTEQGLMKDYYRKVALSWFFCPILGLFLIILQYIIVNVIYGLAK